MRYSPEEIFKKFINSVLSDASLDFFVKRAAVFLSMMMPVSSLFIFRSVEGSITKLAECNKTPAINISDHFAISPESMTRLRTEKHFFSEGACNLKIFTGHETCAYADVHRSVYKTDTSAVYIPLKFNMLRETSVTMVVLSMGVDNYTQEHLDICSCLQPVFIDNFLNILSVNSSDRAFDLPSPKSKQEPNSKRNKDNEERGTISDIQRGHHQLYHQGAQPHQRQNLRTGRRCRTPRPQSEYPLVEDPQIPHRRERA